MKCLQTVPVLSCCLSFWSFCLSRCCSIMSFISLMARVTSFSLPVMAMRVSSRSFGVPVWISTLFLDFISVIIFPFLPTTWRPIPGGIMIVWVFLFCGSAWGSAWGSYWFSAWVFGVLWPLMASWAPLAIKLATSWPPLVVRWYPSCSRTVPSLHCAMLVSVCFTTLLKCLRMALLMFPLCVLISSYSSSPLLPISIGGISAIRVRSVFIFSAMAFRLASASSPLCFLASLVPIMLIVRSVLGGLICWSPVIMCCIRSAVV